MSESEPQLVILAGPNGAGKSTLAPELLRQFGIAEFVNADVIARGLSAFDPDSAALAAGRVMLARLKSLAAMRVSFAFETTLATRSFAPWLHELDESGYQIRIFFVWLADPALCVERVAKRVRSGGHHVPPDTVHRRYQRGVQNFMALYRPLAESWGVFDNTAGPAPRLLAKGSRMTVTEIKDPDRWRQLTNSLDPSDR
ncbi:MAG: AAA family ATPase [Acidobacteria bacterium]|nr:AAA family ATPase [Acidobacteriota bacterium]